MTENKEFEKLAHKSLVEKLNKDVEYVEKYGTIDIENIYTVWLCKTLQNFKGLFSTNISGDKIYAEFTWNGDNNVGYLDIYIKKSNDTIFEY